MVEMPEGGWRVRGVMTHPGAVLREDYMVPLELSVEELARRIHVDRSEVQAIVEEQAPIRPEMALRLAHLFQGTARIWLNLQLQHDLSKAELENGKQLRAEIKPLERLAA